MGFEKRREEEKKCLLTSSLTRPKKNTNGQKSTKQNLIDRHTLLLSVTEYIIYATQCQFCELFADCKCVYVCLFVRISVDTTVIIKKCHCLYKRLQICEFPSLPKMKTTLAIRVFVKKRTTKKFYYLTMNTKSNSLYYYDSNTILIFQHIRFCY